MYLHDMTVAHTGRAAHSLVALVVKEGALRPVRGANKALPVPADAFPSPSAIWNAMPVSSRPLVKPSSAVQKQSATRSIDGTDAPSVKRARASEAQGDWDGVYAVIDQKKARGATSVSVKTPLGECSVRFD